MRYASATPVAILALALLALAACESYRGNDGVSRFAGAGGLDAPYYGPGSPPRDFGASGGAGSPG